MVYEHLFCRRQTTSCHKKKKNVQGALMGQFDKSKGPVSHSRQLENPPKGVSVSVNDSDNFTIAHKRTGMVRMNRYLIIWFLVWTVFGFGLLCEYTGAEGPPPPLWLVVVFLFFEILAAGLVTYMLFCQKLFSFSADRMVIETRLLDLWKKQVVFKNTITCVIQIKDGGVGEDSFPSWGLPAGGPGPAKLLHRQPHKTNSRLGEVIAQWAGVEFFRYSDTTSAHKRLSNQQFKSRKQDRRANEYA